MWRSPAVGAGWLQGIELLAHWAHHAPVPEPDRAYLRSIRRGERPLAEVLDCVDGLGILEAIVSCTDPLGLDGSADAAGRGTPRAYIGESGL